ncbi:hypothetical protein ACFVP8_21830 [Viridibacillus arvi]
MDFLEKSIKRVSFEHIASRLGRTTDAIESKVDKLGIANIKIV